MFALLCEPFFQVSQEVINEASTVRLRDGHQASVRPIFDVLNKLVSFDGNGGDQDSG